MTYFNNEKIRKRFIIILSAMLLIICSVCGLWQYFLIRPIQEEDQPSWSPDSQHLVYQCFLEGPTARFADDIIRHYAASAADICLIDAEGRHRVHLVNTPGSDSSPTWSVDGTQIIYDHFHLRGGIQRWVINVDGSDQRFYTGADPSELVQEPTGLSPNGQWEFKFNKTIIDARTNEIVFQIPDTIEGRDFYISDYKWSPDSQKMAIVIVGTTYGFYEISHIYILKPENKTFFRLTESPLDRITESLRGGD